MKIIHMGRKYLEILKYATLATLLLLAPASTLADRNPNRADLINRVIKTESSGNPVAVNKKTRAIGLMQITPPVLEEWNNFNSQEKYSELDLYNPEINKKIGEWYLTKRIPQQLKSEGIEKNIYNILAAYNWGIGNLKKIGDALKNFHKLPEETKNFIIKILYTNY